MINIYHQAFILLFAFYGNYYVYLCAFILIKKFLYVVNAFITRMLFIVKKVFICKYIYY